MTLTSTARFAALARPKKGRPPYAEKPDAVTQTAEEARIRKLMGVETWIAAKDDPKAMRKARSKVASGLAGYPLGLLRLQDMQDVGTGISQDQHDDGMRYGAMRVRHSRIMGFAPLSPKTPALALVAKETGDGSQADDETVMKIRREYADAYSALADYSKGYDRPTPMQILEAVVLHDFMPRTPSELGNLRVALNVLGNLYRRRRA